jgi:hypothetical protein
MAEFYVTFGGKWGHEVHPTLPLPAVEFWDRPKVGMPFEVVYPHPYGWAVVEAWTFATAQEIANAWIGPENFSCLYMAEGLGALKEWTEMFPRGELARIKLFEGFVLLDEHRGY